MCERSEPTPGTAPAVVAPTEGVGQRIRDRWEACVPRRPLGLTDASVADQAEIPRPRSTGAVSAAGPKCAAPPDSKSGRLRVECEAMTHYAQGRPPRRLATEGEDP